MKKLLAILALFHAAIACGITAEQLGYSPATAYVTHTFVGLAHTWRS